MAEGQAGETGEIRPLGLAGGRWPWLAWEYVRADVRGRSATVRECAHGRGVSTLATVTSADFETITGFCVPVSVFRCYSWIPPHSPHRMGTGRIPAKRFYEILPFLWIFQVVSTAPYEPLCMPMRG